MSEKLAEFTGDMFERGVFPGLPGDTGPFWADARNVVFQERSVQPMAGQESLFSAPANTEVLGLQAYAPAGTKTLFTGYTDKIYKWTTGTPTAVGTGYTGTGFWSMESWGTWMIATNGVDTPQVYKGVSFAALTGLNFTTAEIFLRWSPYLIAFNTSNDGANIEWCDTDNVESWVPGAGSAANNLTVRDLDTEIVAARPLGRAIGFYSGNFMGLLEYKGPPFYFGQRVVLEGIGAVSKKSVQEINNRHYGFGRQGVFVTDGTSFQFIDPPAVHDFIFDDINLDYLHKVVSWHDVLETSVVWYYPQSGYTRNTRGVRFNYQNGSWAQISQPRSAALDNAVFNYAITGDYLGNVYYQNVSGAPVGAVTANPITMTEAINMKLGYGSGGYGNKTYGGEFNLG